ASPETAVAFFDRVVGVFPGLASEARPYRAYFLDRAGETRAALAEYETSLKEIPSARTYALLGDLRARIGDGDEALAAYRQAATLAPDDPRLAALVARALYELGQQAQAEEAVGRRLTPRPPHPPGPNLLRKLAPPGRADRAG